jgi:hypothetical protein
MAEIAQPEAVAVVGDKHVEGPVGAGIEGGQGMGGGPGVGMVEGLEHQLAAAAPPRLGPQRVHPVHHPGDDALVVHPEPAAAGELVEAGDHVGPVGPVAAGRQPGAISHLVAVGTDYHRPIMAGTAQDHDAAQAGYSPRRRAGRAV